MKSSLNSLTRAAKYLICLVPRCRTFLSVGLAWLIHAPAFATGDQIGLTLRYEAGIPQVSTAPRSGDMLLLEWSGDLLSWVETARSLDRFFPYLDYSRQGSRLGFYRVRATPRGPLDDWSNQLAVASPLLFKPGNGSGLANIATAKFSILLAQLDRVYFQDSVKYPFHLQFARARLPGYAGMSVLDYNAQALYANAAQRMVVGTVLRSPDPQVREVGIEITGAEAFPANLVVNWYEAVRRRLFLEEGWRAFYMPSTEQRATTEAHRDLFAQHGIAVDSLGRWATANACYSPGWALGRLVYLPPHEISAALADGRLRFTDILVTDQVPAELPVLAGYICLQPATPNSHVALLARSYLLPFAYANGAGLRAELTSLLGREVLLIVDEANGTCHISLQDTTGLLTEARRQEILASKRGGPLTFTPKAPRGSLTLGADALTPADIAFVGGKAAHFGFLRRTLPNDSPSPALAITFDLWDAYLSQPYRNSGTLRAFIASRMAAHTFPPNVAALRSDLAAIRDAIERGTDFTPTQRAAIIAALWNAGLHGAKIRFRSSTNLEDTESFSGAGLYDSFSGCLEDDTDANTSGPSHCDPAEPNERGVFRALRKVYASFYNENAVLERLRHGVDESKVGMAVLVHFSTPDPLEMANGVITFAVDKSGNQRSVTAKLVSQLGAESITNPNGNARAEVVRAEFSGQVADGAALTLQEPSSLTENGAPVMRWEADYRDLLTKVNAAALAYEQYYPAKTSFELDLEFKRLTPGKVGLKQMRAVPRPVPIPPPTIP